MKVIQFKEVMQLMKVKQFMEVINQIINKKCLTTKHTQCAY